MGQTYTTDELVALHKRSLLDAAAFFDTPEDADFIRHLRAAGRALAQDNKRPRTLAASLTLAAGVQQYPAPDDLHLVKTSPWGVAETQTTPWCAPRGPLPSLRIVTDADGALMLCLTPAPTAAQLAAFGASYPFYYFAAQSVPDTGATSVTDAELDLLLLRAKVEALRELSIRNHSKPVTMHGGAGDGVARNQTAASLYAAFLQEYRDAA